MNKSKITFESFFLKANYLRVQMHSMIKTTAKQFNIQGQELVFLLAISHFDHPTVGLLAKELDVQQANVSKMIRALEVQDFITKTPDLMDTRTYTLGLSDKAQALVDSVKGSVLAHFQESGDTIDLELIEKGMLEMSRLIELYEKII